MIKREVRVCLDQVPGPELWSELAPRGELSVGISDRGCQEITSESGSGYLRRRAKGTRYNDGGLRYIIT